VDVDEEEEADGEDGAGWNGSALWLRFGQKQRIPRRGRENQLGMRAWMCEGYHIGLEDGMAESEASWRLNLSLDMGFGYE